MEKINADVLYFISYCIEQYKIHKGVSGSDAIELFEKKGVPDYLAKHFDVLHTQGTQWIMQEIDDYIINRQQ